MSESLRDESFSVITDRGDTVHGDLRWFEDGRVKPAVIFCHGFKGFKDWGPFPAWGRALANAGFVSVHFNFSHNGVTPEHPTEFVDLDAFADNTYTTELADASAVLDYVAEGTGGLAPVDAEHIGLMGHSRGGGTAILLAERDDRVRALATWASVRTFTGRFTAAQIRDWEAKGYTEVVNGRTGQIMRLNRSLYDDAMAHKEELDILAAAERLDVPWLIVHAEDDEAVDIRAAERLKAAQPDATLVRAEGGHTFGGAHPHDGAVPDSLHAVWDKTIGFFDSALR
jgi:uncharacterized protein